MRRFYLFRKDDPTGVSGVDRVADGVEFDNGVVCLTWKSQFQSVTMFPSISLIEKLHTHLGQHDTKIVWVDEIHENVEEKAALLTKKVAEEAVAAVESDDPHKEMKHKPKKKPKTTKIKKGE